MPGRKRRVERCLRCRLHADLCICAETPRLDLVTRLILVMHYREIRKTTSTAILALNTLVNSEYRLRGLPEQPLNLDDLNDPDRRLLVLYPDPGAPVLSHFFLEKDPRPVSLVIPDGTWKQVARMRQTFIRLPFGETVQLPAGAPGAWSIRKAKYANQLSTFEALARAYGIIESPEVQDQLETIFRLLVERNRQMRGLVD